MPRTIPTLVLCALVTSAAHAQKDARPDDGTRQQLVDVRDLGAALASANVAERETTSETGQSPFRDKAAAPAPETRLEMIVGRIGGAMTLDYEWLDDGLLIVEGTPDRLERFNAMLSDLRALYGETYTVELRVVELGAGDLPALGERASVEGATVCLTRQTVARRVGTSIVSERRQAFVGDLQPVVGDQAVGYDPTIKEAVSSVVASVTVGAGDESARGTPVTLRGVLTHTSVERFKPSTTAQATLPQLPDLELPTVHRRSFNASRRIAFGEPTVIAVIDGLTEGRVMGVEVTILKDDLDVR